MHEYLWIVPSASQTTVVGLSGGRSQAELSCFSLVLHWHLGDIIRWHTHNAKNNIYLCACVLIYKSWAVFAGWFCFFFGLVMSKLQ